MEDKVQSALEEAERLMKDLGGGDDDNNDNNKDNNGEIAFSIDSDDEGEEVELLNPPTPFHPLAPDKNSSNTNSKSKNKNNNVVVDDHPLKPQEQHQLSSDSTTEHASGNVHQLSSSLSALGYPGPSPNHKQQQQQQHQHQYYRSYSTGAVIMEPQQPQASSSSSSTTGAALLGDALKHQTSRLASAMAIMAQRAAHQVASATTHHPPSHQQQQQQQPPSQAAHSSSSFHSMSVSSSSSFGSNSAVVLSSQHQQQQQQQQARVPPELDNEQKAALIRNHVGSLLPGERVIMFLSPLAHVSDSTGFSYSYNGSASSTTMWCCAMTYYRLILFGTAALEPPPRPDDWNMACWPSRTVQVLQMPLASMDRVERAVFPATAASNTTMPTNINAPLPATMSLMGLHCQGKDNARFIRFTTPSYADTVRAHEALQTYAFPGKRNLGYLFAFESKKDAVMKSIVTDPNTGLKQVTLPSVPPRFNAIQEFTRQLQKYNNTTCPWAIYTSLNANYQLCASYPNVLVGPVILNEANPDSLRILQQSAAFRSEQRLPILTYAHAGTGGTIWRASQPKIGLQGNRSSADEWLLKQVLEQAVQANNNAQQQRPFMTMMPSRQVLMQLTGSASLEQLASNWWPSTTTGELKILDLRPRSSAMANRTGGYGYENTSNYAGTTIQFCNIGNIHAVRDAYQKMSNACMSLHQNELQWTSTLEDTKWLASIRLILSASWETAYWIHVFSLPVLIHCSHGWDRTSQVAALAQLILDPYYRTMQGFACLVEKDFMAFGHPFHTRCAHGVGGGGASMASSAVPVAAVASTTAAADFDEGQVSPIFIQFLDCVYQLVNLYPEAFEFDTRYLFDLSDHVYSCRFGNFLCDTEREREMVAGIRQRTHSVWDFLETKHRPNPNNMVQSGGVLLMPLPTLLRNVSLWTDRHALYGPKPTQRWPTTQQEQQPQPLSAEMTKTTTTTESIMQDQQEQS